MGVVSDLDRLQPQRRSEPPEDDGPVLANIYLGNIKTWNDARIKKLNPNVNLPSTAITPVYRSDGSGTTYNFTDYLSAVSPAWKSKVGNSTQVNFPTGIGAGAAPALPASSPAPRVR